MVRLYYLIALLALAFGLANAQAAMAQNTSPSNTPYLTSLNITNFFIPANISVYSPLSLSFNITNTGSFASGNIVVELNVYGESQINETFSLAPLAPGQSELVLAYLNNATDVPGGYVAYLDSGYSLDGTYHATGRAVEGYSVMNSGFAGGASLASNSFGTIAGLKIASMPFIYYFYPQSSLLSQVEFSYNGGGSAKVDMSIPPAFAGVMSLSTSSLFISENQSLRLGVLFSPAKQQYEDTYIIPMEITELQGGASQSVMRYVHLSTLNNYNGSAGVIEQVNLLNNSQASSATIQVDSPANASLYNARLEIIVPGDVTNNASRISAYGSIANTSSASGMYLINWYIGSVQQDQRLYLYYGIAGLKNIDALLESKIILVSETPPSAQGIFRILNTSLPVFYTDSNHRISINAIYTGAVPANMTLSLPAYPGVIVHNSTDFVHVMPNQQIQAYFDVASSNYSGVAPLKLSVSVDGISSEYSIPVVILPKPSTLAGEFLSVLSDFRYPISGLIALVLIITVYNRRRSEKPVPYSAEKARTLINIKNQINRDRRNS